MDQKLFATDPDLKKGFLANQAQQNTKRNPKLKSIKRRRMPAKRKRSYSTKRSYKRRRYAPSASSVARQMSKILQPTGPFGDPTSANYQRYGPSRQQMIDNPGAVRTAAQTQARLLDNYRGPGDYEDVGRQLGTGIGGIAGAIGGAMTTNPVLAAGLGALGAGAGGQIGGAIGHAFDYAGQGDYYGRTANQIVAGSRQPIAVNQGADRTGDIVISQTEFIGNLTADNKDFKLDPYEINPGNKTLFPFLSQIAQNYELYEWVGLMVMFKPTTGEGGNNNALGKVVITTNYDPNCRNFNNSLEMQNYDYASSGKPSQTIVHGIETAVKSRLTRMLYVRDEFDNSRDREFTDIGKLFIATEGIPVDSTTVLGELHITYSCRLSRAKLFSHIGAGIASQNLLVDLSLARTERGTQAKSEGSEIFKVLNDDSNFRIKLQVADKNLVSKAMRIVVHVKYDAALASGESMTMAAAGATPSGTIFFKADPTLQNSDTHYFRAGMKEGEQRAMLMFDVCINNSNDALPSFTITSTADYKAGQMFIQCTEIETFDSTTKVTELADF